MVIKLENKQWLSTAAIRRHLCMTLNYPHTNNDHLITAVTYLLNQAKHQPTFPSLSMNLRSIWTERKPGSYP
jgi:hypothetical protein